MSETLPFVALEGSDGSGKGTVFAGIKQLLTEHDIPYHPLDFPRYEELSGKFAQEYLNGNFGPATEVPPEVATTFFALDRYFAGEEIRKARALGEFILSNRYTGSNLAHQGAKIADKAERHAFFEWNADLEFKRFGTIRPDLNIALILPAEIGQQRVLNKAAETRRYTTQVLDGHEQDLDYLRRSVEVYEELCDLYPEWFTPIECVVNGRELTAEEVTQAVWEKIEEQLQ